MPLTFAAFAVATFLFFLALWALWIAPRRIRGAVSQRRGPRTILTALKTSWGYWLLALLLAVLAAGAMAYLSWRYLGFWLYTAPGDWRDQLAGEIIKTLWVLQIPVAGLDYERIVPLGIVTCTLLGVLAGTLAGAWLGIRLAAKHYLITRTLFRSS